ncbi:MAG: UDP-N-acetylmuramate:L-alanyl-gamma-D-glutamyl-meso-diaminopimelate ligase [Bdellovibrionales bacterium]|nr:UDP-N-acetylmuramate:L-alanyl-gamma-D-glutamyl-meso-diaminopimelate ligase [Bdellovibrionales bacterium]
MKLKVPSHIHLMGICGTAMASLAGLFKEMGHKVTGSDQNVYPPMSTQLENLGIPIMEGYKKENLTPAPDLVVVGNVITRNHEEAVALMASDIAYTSLPKAIGEFVIEDRNSIVISGTHGKTTTTSMMAWIAEKCNKKPGFLIGGIPGNFENSFRVPEDQWFVIEGDEYDTAFFDKVPKFIHYRPKFVVVTSIEFDHADIYQDLEQIKEAFRSLVRLVPEEGLIVAHGDDPNVEEVLKECRCRVIRYGLRSGDYQAGPQELLVGRNQFSVFHDGKNVGEIAIKSFGDHNTLNALAAFALASELGWDRRSILQALAEFKGVKRRQEILGEPQGIKVIEDFAHHPTAVSLTVSAIKKMTDGKLFAVFEPRSATSRRRIFQKQYVEAFKGADEALVMKPYDQSRISDKERMSTEELVQDIQKAGGRATAFISVDDIVKRLVSAAVTGDTILIMSNGSFDGIYKKLLSALEARS